MDPIRTPLIHPLFPQDMYTVYGCYAVCDVSDGGSSVLDLCDLTVDPVCHLEP